MKEFKNIKSVLKLETLCADKENGLYLVEEMADTLENHCAEMAAITLKNEVLTEEVNALKLRAQIAEDALQAKVEELNQQHNEAIAELNAKHDEAIAELNAKNETAMSEAEELHRAVVEKLNAELNDAKEVVAAKDREIDELASAAPEPQTPAKPSGTESQTKKWDEMTLEEKRETFYK